ncbi:hypothetical protein ASH00_15865 [Arthrobacter sp. Soil782]|uniref:hypothetical protein n=1 Tax=Arthrobacter sp. Soil782 TaxID=1736410 RepID=UPI0006FFB9D2|nr:hypothetical protein [Arthrobacter sp. Soil782]KRF03261.1 hypothetical protein ASH00_15865 [Arthrobacter sp. Soil782]
MAAKSTNPRRFDDISWNRLNDLAVQNAIEIDRHDLVAELIATGLVGSTTTEHALEAAASTAEFELAMAAEQALAA